MAEDELSELEQSVSSLPTTSRESQTSSSQHAGASASPFFTSRDVATGEPRRRPQAIQTATEGYGTINRAQTREPSQTPLSPELRRPDRSIRRPSEMKRRTTSSMAPHRGQEFSVDDAEDEVAQDEVVFRRPNLGKTKSSLVGRPQIVSGTSTVKRRPAAHVPTLPKVDSYSDEDLGASQTFGAGDLSTSIHEDGGRGINTSSGEETIQAEEEEAETPPTEEDDEMEEAAELEEDDEDLSDAESFTLKDRQEAINVTHPFGIRIWKPALYKKSRSVQKNAEGDIHSTPGGHVNSWIALFNYAWTILFGWWLALIAFAGAVICAVLGSLVDGNTDYANILLGLAKYIFYPFGKYVKLMSDDVYAEEDQGEGRSISEYEQWQNGDIEEGRLFFGPVRTFDRALAGRHRNSVDSADENESLLGRRRRSSAPTDGAAKTKRRLFGRGKWTFSRALFFAIFYGFISPPLFLVSAICWLLVFTIPMGRVTLLLFDHLRRHPLALEFHQDKTGARSSGEVPSSVLVCTYRAVGTKYWKYTIDGTNIFLINLLAVVAFTIFDYYVLEEILGLKIPLTNNGLIFALALFSIIPLAYFIGQAVASISAQSSMGIGATINAFFSTIVEVFLYCVALKEGKARLVEGSVIGSIFAGILFLPGISMCFGAIERKTQRFNVRSAGVTSTMLLFAIIGAFSPALFYQIYGSHELNCHQCKTQFNDEDRDCRRCYFSQTPAIHDPFYLNAVRPYIWFCAVMLFVSYAVGLLFTLRTHAAVIWNTEIDEKKHERMAESSTTQHGYFNHRHQSQTPFPTLSRSATRTDLRDTQLYRRILGQSLKQIGATEPHQAEPGSQTHQHKSSTGSAALVIPANKATKADPAKSKDATPVGSPVQQSHGIHLPGLSEEDNRLLERQVAEMAVTVATVAARDVTRGTHSHGSQTPVHPSSASIRPSSRRASRANIGTGHNHGEAAVVKPDASVANIGTVEATGGGHDAPNWSRKKSTAVLLSATVAYAIIAEILVNTVDSVLKKVDIDEKFLGITLFALVPNTTEFLNAISFAMNGNIALSMEIGSAYALQVCLLQIPALVLFSGVYGRFIDRADIFDHTFTLIFPQWDMVTVILCVFLLSYMYGEGKSNYFKGSILILSYLVVVVGFYFSSFDNLSQMQLRGVDPMDSLALGPRWKVNMANGYTGFRGPKAEL